MFEVLYNAAVSENADYAKGTAEGFFQSKYDIEWEISYSSLLQWNTDI